MPTPPVLHEHTQSWKRVGTTWHLVVRKLTSAERKIYAKVTEQKKKKEN